VEGEWGGGGVREAVGMESKGVGEKGWREQGRKMGGERGRKCEVGSVEE